MTRMVMRVYFLSAVFFLTNCDDPAASGRISPDYSDAIQLAVGNFWVFEVTETDSRTGKTTKKEDETISIADLYIIDGKEVFRMNGPTYEWVRVVIDSAGYLKDFSTGAVLFAGVNIPQTVFEDDMMHIAMTNVDSVITVPAGTFKTVNYKRKSKLSGVVLDRYYANGIGVIKQVDSLDGKIVERNLVIYNVSKP